ncbi:unnamed protein product [Blepharisma stoltei]|uniref:t-SNARE coiled-coil homology domain-containing protein n=1 Tax=Blepharisma stoltei TaxID=1481888 RepID=A0AAU9JZ94_9CILI|nr:unnamed protein product [Blepharisma stoltei]
MSTNSKGQSFLLDHAQMVRDFQHHVKKLKDHSNHIGTSKDNNELRLAIAAEKESAMNLCQEILDAFKTQPPNRAEKLQHDKLTKEFEALSKQFTLICRGLVEKQKTIIIEEEKERSSRSVEQSKDTIHSSDFKSVGGLEDSLLNRSRVEELEVLEKDMEVVNQMFKDVAVMANEQGVLIDEAVENVDTAVKETGRAEEELVKAEKYQKKSKRKVLCILGIVAIVVIVLLGIVLATIVF